MSTTSNTTIDREEAHERVKQRDVRDSHAIGETLEVVLEKDPEANSGRSGIARRDGIVVFVHPGRCVLDIGAHLSVQLSDVTDSYMHAVALERFD